MRCCLPTGGCCAGVTSSPSALPRAAGVGGDAGGKAVRTIGDRRADCRTLALVGAVLFEGVLRRFQGDVVAGFDVAAAHQDAAVFAAAGGDQVDVATGLQGGALGGGATLLGLALALAAAHGVDLRTGTTFWQGQAQASSGENQNSGGGLIGMLVTAAVNQVINQVTDRSHQIGNVASQRLLSTGHAGGPLYGPYNPKYGTD
ncbi:hypothetical protein XarzCFBP7410_07470 [Xanthomonas arboricola pv. zantedeschiae]|nr:hypothetical protein XarbCFBP8153_11970 [Xanthomonas arboricola]PPT85064.1 hypothetical protein XarzCFBP7410_07470 [Xanthomonas arboricola pv. zantedeschiae]